MLHHPGEANCWQVERSGWLNRSTMKAEHVCEGGERKCEKCPTLHGTVTPVYLCVINPFLICEAFGDTSCVSTHIKKKRACLLQSGAIQCRHICPIANVILHMKRRIFPSCHQKNVQRIKAFCHLSVNSFYKSFHHRYAHRFLSHSFSSLRLDLVHQLFPRRLTSISVSI